ncbi:archease [Amycolatopsis mongoliensis]|uniref:Archease n=1 Tax=Amycolatopsis mongoliensis TaxID=715475 RepID=A0A9Y2JHN1_9PSEU|nr:archease [Amycolatopsis sp. 4-36]WIX98252.1 archease [Amycolatopsis sp. 4-36]
MTERRPSGHRAVAHTADLRVEAWATTRERCIAEAVAGMVASFAEPSGTEPHRVVEQDVRADGDADLLAAVLDDVIYRLDTAGEIPVHTDIQAAPGRLRARFTMIDAAAATPVGSVPKAVSLHELRCAPGPDGWSCSVTIDV